MKKCKTQPSIDHFMLSFLSFGIKYCLFEPLQICVCVFLYVFTSVLTQINVMQNSLYWLVCPYVGSYVSRQLRDLGDILFVTGRNF